MKRWQKSVIVGTICVSVLLVGCATAQQSSTDSQTTEFSATTQTTQKTDTAVTNHNSTDTTYPSVEVDASWQETDYITAVNDAVEITLSDNGTTADGDGVLIDGSTVTINGGGAYYLSGTLSDGQLRVDSSKSVQLIFAGVSIDNSIGAPLFVKDADKVVLTLADGTQNFLIDGEGFLYEDEVEQEPSAALFSKSDLTINGNGALTVNAVFNDGIVSRDGLKIVSGQIHVNAADDAIMGRDYVLIGNGTLTLSAAGDGIKSTNDTADTVGFVAVENGNITIESGSDGIQAESSLTVKDGVISVVAGGGSQNGTTNIRDDFAWHYDTTASVDTTSVGKGLKAGVSLTIDGGDITVDAADDAIHANTCITMNGGSVTAAAGDDGMHADETLTVSNGNLTITKSYEGLEAGSITIDGGTLSITASDDGVNASSGTLSNDRNPFASDGASFVINGGTVFVDAQGDGLDSNGTITMNGGDVTVLGPQNGANGTLDFASSFDITTGSLMAVGSSGMAQMPTSNNMNSVVWSGFAGAGGDTVSIADDSGNVILSVKLDRAVDWAYFTCASLQSGSTYTVSCGAMSETLTLSQGVNTLGNGGMGMGGPMGGGHMGGGPMGGPMGGYGYPF